MNILNPRLSDGTPALLIFFPSSPPSFSLFSATMATKPRPAEATFITTGRRFQELVVISVITSTSVSVCIFSSWPLINAAMTLLAGEILVSSFFFEAYFPADQPRSGIPYHSCPTPDQLIRLRSLLPAFRDFQSRYPCFWIERYFPSPVLTAPLVSTFIIYRSVLFSDKSGSASVMYG